MAIFDDLVTSIKDVLRKHQVTHEEYRQAVTFAQELAGAGEIPLFSDVFFEMAVVETNYGQRPGTSSTVEGPYYVEGAPLLERPFQLPRRLNEPGEVLIFSGTVRTADGSPLAGAVLYQCAF
jgi:catechol 1,2-dioxygenase